MTGASRNIGAAIAERLARDGAAIAVNHPGPETAGDATQVAERIVSSGGHAVPIEADIGDGKAVASMVETVETELGAPDILVNNAAVYVSRNVAWEEDTPEDWAHVMRVNVIGPFLCARAVVPGMRARRRGDIVNIASITALLGWTGNLPYVTSKAALIGMTRCLARELGPDGIRVNAVAPGAVITPEQEEVFGPTNELLERFLPEQALKRPADPSDIAGAVAMLVSPDAGFITGQCVAVDGGWSMR